ncbi:MAG: hypothetical protein NE327_18125 [Lentisphaeraceae bacterium]|nr:hypothetical protein [Lentisphaeraceae bacterium]
MPKGLKVALAILAVGISIPVVTMFLTLGNKPTYHTIQPQLPDQNCFVQFTWQEKPVSNLEHLLIFLEKPEKYVAKSTLEIVPFEETVGYCILPRGVFFDNTNIIKSKQKIYRMAKKDMRTWIIIKGKAFSAEIDKSQLAEIKAIVDGIKDHKNPSAEQMGQKLMATTAWQELMKQLAEKRDLLAKDELDLEPDRKRSDFMR